MVEIPNRDAVARAIKATREIAARFQPDGWPVLSQLPEPERERTIDAIDAAVGRLRIAAPEHWPLFNADGTRTLPAWHRSLIDNLGFAKTSLLRVKEGRREDAGSPRDVLFCLNQAAVCADSIPASIESPGARDDDEGHAKPTTLSDDDEESASPALTVNQSRVLQTMARFDASRLVSADAIAAEMDAAGRLSARTIGPIVRRLIELRLAERPEGDRSGARLTTAGRRLAPKIAD